VSILQTLFQHRSRRHSAAGWLGIHCANGERIVAAHAASRDAARPRVQLAPVFEGADGRAALLRWQREHHRHAEANVLVNTADYRVLPLEAPQVPPDELRAALRWQLKDLIDFPADEACIDCLRVPGATLGSNSHRLLAIAAMPEVVGGWMKQYREARLTLGAIDIPELALRNLSVLCAGDSAHAFVHIGQHWTRLTLVWQRELCSFRQFDVAASGLGAADVDTRSQMIERLALEVQRSTDSFSRQFHGADLESVWVSAMHDADEVSRQLAQLLPHRVERFRLEDHLDLVGRDVVVESARGLDFTLAIGAALRDTVH
jgi:MSHA biogenesis protein MshI